MSLREFISLIDLTFFIFLIDLSQSRPDNGILEIAFNQGIWDTIVSKSLSSSHQLGLFVLDIERIYLGTVVVHKEKLTLHAVESLSQIFLSLLQEIAYCLSWIGVIFLE